MKVKLMRKQSAAILIALLSLSLPLLVGEPTFVLGANAQVSPNPSGTEPPNSTPTPIQTPLPTPTATPEPTPTPTPQTKKTATLSIEAEKSNESSGLPLTISGRLYAPGTIGIAIQDILLSYSTPENASWTPVATCMTNEWGKYGYRWMTPPAGTFTLKAEWIGNSEFQPASNTTTLSMVLIEDQQAIIQSNSTVTQITYSQTVGLSFTVSGNAETAGYAKVAVPKSLMPQNQSIKVYLDQKTVPYDLVSSGDSWIISFTYNHSTHQVLISNSAGNLFLGLNSWIWITAAAVALVSLVAAAGVIVWLAKTKKN